MSIAKNTFINIISAGSPLIIGILTVPKYLELIGAEKYGLLAIILTIQSYFSFMDLGLGKATTQEISKSDSNNKEWHSKIYWTSTITTIAVSSIGSALALLSTYLIFNYGVTSAETPEKIEIKEAIYIAIICIPVLLLSSINIGALQAKQIFGKIAIIQTAGSILSQIAPLLFALYNINDLRILIASTLGARIIALLFLLNECSKNIAINKPKFDTLLLKKLINYGGWLSVISFLSPLLTIIDRGLIGAIKGPAAVSAYTIPYDLVSRSMIISSAFSSASFPRMAAAGIIKSEEIAIKSSKILNAITTVVILISITLFDPLLKIWINKEQYILSTGIGEILLIGVWINSLVIPYHTNYISNKNPKKIAKIFLIEIPVYIFLLYIGITTFGPIGAAYAWTTRVTIDAIILLKLNNAINKNLGSIALSIITIASSLLLSSIEIDIYTTLFTISTIILIYIFFETKLNSEIKLILTKILKREKWQK